MVINTGDKSCVKKDMERSQTNSTSDWDQIVSEALDSGMTSEEYVEFIRFMKEIISKIKKLEMPIPYYFQMFWAAVPATSPELSKYK
ncbi:hypothetical protein [Halalkalibacter lacteus]|uniref:hypothetical protein n=1 Tax=Halalkalibacter lacteus TaxID=3090663 RepID=UPI002FC60EB9